MAVIAIANQKGGCGKSTTAVHLAHWLQKHGPTILIDADAQQSSSHWLSGMSEPPPYEVMRSPDDILEKIPAIADQYKYVILNSPSVETRGRVQIKPDSPEVDRFLNFVWGKRLRIKQ